MMPRLYTLDFIASVLKSIPFPPFLTKQIGMARNLNQFWNISKASPWLNNMTKQSIQ